MSNLHNIYLDATSIPDEDADKISSDVLINESLEFKQQRIDKWLLLQESREFVSIVQNLIDTKIVEAIKLAATYPQHKNHDKVIHTLVEVNTLKETLNKMTYAS